MFSTASLPFLPWRTALIPLLALLLLTSVVTRLGRARKEQLGTAEHRRGRKSSQVAANLGIATLLACQVAQSWQRDLGWLHLVRLPPTSVYIASLAALCESAADTVSSELGQVLSGSPRMITSFRVAPAGTDGAISLGGSLAGIVAAGLVAIAATFALHADATFLALSWSGGVFGLIFDSLLGASIERRGWINNDAVNFLSTLSAFAFALLLLALMAHARSATH
jgi:uncharacterized protein (TIGR00297 family)